VAGGVAAQTDGVDALIRAAGGVLCRPGTHGPEIAIVHRPRLDDWSLPKGKLHRGEHPMVGACREVWEETGVRPVLTGRLPTVSYQVIAGGQAMPKTVRYFVMRVDHDDGFVPGPETDLMAWLPAQQALQRLSYDRDVMVVSTLLRFPPAGPAVLLVRHATAGSAAGWSGPDLHRPLDSRGAARATALGEVLACFAPQRLLSAAPRRCQDTLAPLAATLGRPVEVEHAFDEDADPAYAVAALLSLAVADAGAVPVICSQGALIPALLAKLTGGDASQYVTAKGEGWLLGTGADGGLLTVDPLE
jgi:8-oxo-(d)GTP phosphatase